MLSLTEEYAMRAMIYIADQAPGTFVLAGKISEELVIPSTYLMKVLGALAQKGLLISRRGRQGGFQLAKPANAITAYEIVCAVEPQKPGPQPSSPATFIGSCLVPASKPGGWQATKEEIAGVLKRQTLDRLAKPHGC